MWATFQILWYKPRRCLVNQTFKTICCDRRSLRPDTFEQVVLLACLPRRYRLLGRLLWLLNQDYFFGELQIIAILADCQSQRELMETYESLRGLRERLPRIRMKRQCLSDFAAKIFPNESPAATGSGGGQA